MSKNRILIVNNESKAANTLSSILRVRNYLVSIALEAEEALRKAKDERPNLILLEAKMNGISGYDVCTRLKADRATRNIPVIMVSENGGSESVLKARTSGASDYMVKPFNLFTLLSKLRKFLVD